MPKTISLRYSPEVGRLIEETREWLGSTEARPVTTTEVIQIALALVHSTIVSGNIKVILQHKEIGPKYKDDLALARGYKKEGLEEVKK